MSFKDRLISASGFLSCLLVLGSCLSASQAQACLCSDPESTQEAYDQSDAAFTGRVVSSSTHSFGGVRAFRFQVKQAFKGVAGPEVWVATTLSSGACAYGSFAPQQEFLVFARKLPPELPYDPIVAERLLFTEACTGTRPLSDAEEALRDLGEARIRFPSSWRPAGTSTFLEVDLDSRGGVDFRRDLEIDRSTVEAEDVFGQPLLLFVSMTDNREMLDLCLAQGADPNVTGPFGVTPLMTAASAGNVNIVRTLVEAGADIEPTSQVPAYIEVGTHATALSFAARLGHSKIASYLLRHGAKVEGSPKADRSPLVIAIDSDEPEVVEVLFAHGASLVSKHGTGEDLLGRVKKRSANGLEIKRILNRELARQQSR